MCQSRSHRTSTISANCPARSRPSRKVASHPRTFSKRACSSACRSSGRRMNSYDSLRADGGAGGAAGIRTPTRGPAVGQSLEHCGTSVRRVESLFLLAGAIEKRLAAGQCGRRS
jgi:hypothetical protein